MTMTFYWTGTGGREDIIIEGGIKRKGTCQSINFKSLPSIFSICPTYFASFLSSDLERKKRVIGVPYFFFFIQ